MHPAIARTIRYSSIPVGAVAVALMLGTYVLLALPPSLPLLVLGFCGTFGLYQADRVFGFAPEDAYNQPDRVAWGRRRRWWALASTAASAVVGVAMLPLLSGRTLAAGAVLAAVGVLYVAPLLPRRRRLKAVWYLKPAAIAGAWSAGGVLLPVLEAGAALSSGVAALFAYRFLIVLANALLADWPDRFGDARAGLETVATRWTARRLHATAAACLVAALVGGGTALVLFDASPLLYIDLAGPALLLGYALRPFRSSPTGTFAIDALVAWPALTALAALVGVG